MRNSVWLIFGTACCCATLASWAWAQKPLSFKATSSYIQPLPEGEAESFSSSASSLSADFSRSSHRWLSDLQRAGFIDRSLPRPYRVAVPTHVVRRHRTEGKADLCAKHAGQSGNKRHTIIYYHGNTLNDMQLPQ